MNDSKALGPLIGAKNLEDLPGWMIYKYSKERLDFRIEQAEKMLYKLFSGGSDNYPKILQEFNGLAGESDEIKTLLLENKKIEEIMQVVLYILVSGKHVFVSEMENINRSIAIVFKSDFGQEPWKGEFLNSIGNNLIYIDQVEPLVVLFKELNIPEEEYKTALAKTLKNTEENNRGSSVEILLIRKKHGIEIEPEKIRSLMEMADQSLKFLMFARAIELLEALIAIGHDVGAERGRIVSTYRSNCDTSERTKIIKEIGMDAGIIPKPKEPDLEKQGPESVNIKKIKPWWKFW